MKKRLLPIGILVVLLFSYLLYNYIYKDHRNISAESAEYTISAANLLSEFATDSDSAQAKYLNKTILIKGYITDQTPLTVTFNNSIFGSFQDSTKTSTIKKISMKGRFIGYDDLLEEIKLDQCTLIPLSD